jgi:hypothetical protein
MESITTLRLPRLSFITSARGVFNFSNFEAASKRVYSSIYRVTARREPVGRHHWHYQKLVMRDIKGKIGELAQLNRRLAQLTGAGLPPVPFK